MQLIEVREDLDNPDPKYSDLYLRMGERPDIDYWVKLASSFPSPPRILELGCGAGGLVKPLARCGFEVWGVDIDSKMLDLARQDKLSNLTLIQGRAEEVRLSTRVHLVILASHLTDFSVVLFRSDFALVSEKNRMKVHKNQWIGTMSYPPERLTGVTSRGQTMAPGGAEAFAVT
jgi:SAM-dependent methyltransferase